MIRNTDDEDMQPGDVEEIRESRCIHCQGAFSEAKAIFFTRLVRVRKIIWWHAIH